MRILFLDASTRLETIYDLKRRPRGGMVSSLFHVSDYLASRGHDVTVFSDIKHSGCTTAGTKWLHEIWGTYDVLITNRGAGDGYPLIDARKRILWTHDLPHNGFVPEPKTLRAFAYVVFMSQYAEDIWRTFYRDIGRSELIPNGVDKDLFYPREKDRRYLIYFSHPIRGLKRLPAIADALRERLGDVKVRAYSNARAMYPGEPLSEDHGDQYELPKGFESGSVELCEPVPQRQLAEEVGRAGLCILPSGYPEICSNSVLQALASGTPVITTGGLGSAPEWVKHRHSGMLTRYQPADYMVHTLEIVRLAVEVLENDSLHERLMTGARNTKILTWNQVGAKWERLLNLCC